MFFRYKTKFISDIEQKNRKLLVNIAVAPFVGVWIEISKMSFAVWLSPVAPFAGAWIEMMKNILNSGFLWSLPSWECGLKSVERK